VQAGDFLFGVVRLNVAVAISCLPLLAMLVLPSDPLRAFPAILLGAFLSSPGLAATFAAFRDMSAFQVGPGSLHDEFSDSPAMADPYWGEEDRSVFRPFVTAWKKLAGRALAVSALPVGLALVLGVDVVWAMAESSVPGAWGGMLAPLLVVLAAFCVTVWMVALVLVAELAGGSWWAIVRAAGACAARRWYLSLFSLAVLVVYCGGVILQPLLVLVLASSLALYLIWANSRWSALPVLRASVARAAAGSVRGR
jgi:hypothetical protein